MRESGKVRFGVVGTNFISDWVLAGAREDGRFELSAVCSRSAERGAEFAARHGGARVFTTVEAMADWEGVDAVYIASPNFCHAGQAIACMERGKHVLVEKPMALGAVEGRAMIEASRRNGVALMEAMKPTLTPHFANLRRELGRVGRLRRYVANYCQRSSRYDRYLAGELPNAFNPAYGGGALMDIGVYCLYPMVVLLGRPHKVTASSALLASGVDGEGVATMEYDGGVLATVMYSKVADSQLWTELQGEDGTLGCDSVNRMAVLRFRGRGVNTGGVAGKGGVELDLSVRAEHDEYFYEVKEFIDVVLSGRLESDVNSHSASLTVLEITDEIKRVTGIKTGV